MNTISKLHFALCRVGRALQSPFLLLIRLYWGWQFFLTGRGKLMHYQRTVDFFASLNIPAPRVNAILAPSTELVGGLLLLVGLFSRFAALALAGVMAVAYATDDRKALLSIFSDPDKFLGADPFLFLYFAVLIFIFGPGRLALERLIFREPKP